MAACRRADGPPRRTGRPRRAFRARPAYPRPPLAGATGLPYRRIAPYSVLAAPAWATAEVGAGYAATAFSRRVLTVGVPVLVCVVIAAAVTGAAVRRGERKRVNGGQGKAGCRARIPQLWLAPAPDGGRLADSACPYSRRCISVHRTKADPTAVKCEGIPRHTALTSDAAAIGGARRHTEGNLTGTGGGRSR
ncbi:protein of unknown function [Streptantibioticus cattleyicolor NRRL 8057 = DSM 46488]|nr:protein of unknown function [Streptantibioticus cattleyicolor NRRL 8057 = DSM 46488]